MQWLGKEKKKKKRHTHLRRWIRIDLETLPLIFLPIAAIIRMGRYIKSLAWSPQLSQPKRLSRHITMSLDSMCMSRLEHAVHGSYFKRLLTLQEKCIKKEWLIRPSPRLSHTPCRRYALVSFCQSTSGPALTRSSPSLLGPGPHQCSARTQADTSLAMGSERLR